MPNIAIYEGGKAARMNGVSLITTDDGDGGKVGWVPQSDRQTGTLHVSQNGTYRAEDEGLHSWSKVTVRLAGAPLGLEVPTLPDPITGAEIPTGEIGLEEPVPPAGLEPIEDEPISTDEAERILDDLGGYDTDPDSPDYSLDPSSPDYDDAIDAIADALGTDPDDVKVIDPDDREDVKDSQPKVEDNGQQVTGTDPETGEPATITPSGKEGVIVPDELRILSSPSRTNYKDGDAISYSGLSCGLYKDGKLIRMVSIGELGLPMTVAEYSGEYPSEYTNGAGLNVEHLTSSPQIYAKWYSTENPELQYVGLTPIVGTYGGEGVRVGIDADLYVTYYNGTLFWKGSGGSYLFHYVDSPGSILSRYYGWALRATILGGADAERFTECAWGQVISAPTSTVDPRLGETSPMWEVGQRQSVPVNWSGDGTSLSASFEIMVTKSSLD